MSLATVDSLINASSGEEAPLAIGGRSRFVNVCCRNSDYKRSQTECDGCLLYNFTTHRLSIMDLDNYHLGPFRTEMGLMFGSTRLMAPEEFVKGAMIDQRTSVFTLGRAVLVLRGLAHGQVVLPEHPCAARRIFRSG
jgi:hypothetical protein